MTSVMGFSLVFDKLFFSSQLGYQKPDFLYFQEITRTLRMKSENLLFWDDNETNVEAAREYRWQAEVYTGFEEFQRKLANYLDYKGVTA
jgi:HAD superfamily hydrolase (TIGR01509 family)